MSQDALQREIERRQAAEEHLEEIRGLLERRAAQADRAEALYRDLFENAAGMMAVIDMVSGQVLECNQALADCVDRSKDDIVGESFTMLYPPDARILADAAFAEFAAKGKVLRAERQLYRSDGAKIDVLLLATPIRDQTGKVVASRSIWSDITELKRAERKLAEQARELARSNAELQEFAYVASHDLQEPLRMVSSYVQLLARRYKDKLDSDADEFIGYAVDGAARMKRLINDLLSFSRIGTRGKEFQSVDCRAAVDQAMANLSSAIAESGAEAVCGDLPKVAGDEGQMVQLFQNLIGNGIKFRGDSPPRIIIESKRDGSKWEFSVRDNGIGIDLQYAERIFAMFQRLHGKGEYAGTGIGLAICKKIVERHGGRIWMESEVGQGTVFRFTIPEGRLGIGVRDGGAVGED